MKIRIKNNSVRFRLTQGEVEALRDSGTVSALTAFPGSKQFGYSVGASATLESPAAEFAGGVISVSLPNATVLDWASTDQVTIECEQLLEDGSTLTLLVEKDFACLAPRPGEDESDMFPHPNQNAVEC